MVTNKKNKIIEFPSKIGTSSPPVTKDDIQNFNDYEGYEDDEYFYLLAEKDYPGLIQYCLDRAAENPNDLHAKAHLGMGMTEDDYDWSKKPFVLRRNKDIIDACYLYLGPRRKPRSIYDIHNEFAFKGFVAFTPVDITT